MWCVPQIVVRSGPALRGNLSVASDLYSLACEWEQLAERVDASPFLRPGWILPWSRAFGTGTPEAITVRRGDELTGVLPMQRKRGRLYSLANWHSPVFGPLLADDDARDALLEGLFGARRSAVELNLLDGDGGLLRRIDSHAREAGRRVIGRPIALCPVVEIAGSFSDFERGLSRNRRRSLRRGRNALEAEGRVDFDIHESPDGLERALEEVYRVEASGWKGKRGTAIASGAHTARFYSDVARWAAERSWLRLSFLRLDGRAIACDYSIAFNGAWYSLKSGYDEDYRRFGPGALLLREQLRHCFEQGASCLELLGTEDSFKRSWTERACERTRVHAFDRSPAGVARWTWVAARERVRDRIARGNQAVASAVATWDSLGLEALPLAA
jgi:CelD/BcsL family acetyltransferase involved in cellulose biosynthesis